MSGKTEKAMRRALRGILQEQGVQGNSGNGNPGQTNVQIRRQEINHSGPIPMASEFEKYNIVLPGAGDRILTMAEKEQSFSHEITEKRDKTHFGINITGLVVGVIVILGVLFAGIYAIYLGQTDVAITIFGTTIVALGANTVAIILRKK